MFPAVKKGSINTQWTIESEEELANWAEQFVKLISTDETILLHGAMGSGKTTLVRYLMNALKGDEASSPSFSLVNEYRYPGGVVYHFDLYRMEQPEELEEIGFDEYLDSEAICLIEWPDLGAGYYLEDGTSILKIEALTDGIRQINWLNGIVL